MGKIYLFGIIFSALIDLKEARGGYGDGWALEDKAKDIFNLK